MSGKTKKKNTKRVVTKIIEKGENWYEAVVGEEDFAFCKSAIYSCPCCEETVLERSFSFCPNCGVELKWEVDRDD